ncbi:hypothetical protein ACM1L7_001497 [Campylobacter jejuni]|nr:hypothetical protein [Campylobacter jejuni]
MLCNNKTNARVVSSCKSSIMDSYLFGFHPHTQPNSQKSSISHKRTELKPNKQVVKLLVHLPNG